MLNNSIIKKAFLYFYYVFDIEIGYIQNSAFFQYFKGGNGYAIGTDRSQNTSAL
jgi:hypothetical protein